MNVAARLESLAEPGGICVSESIRSAAGSKLALDFEFLGEQSLKNIAEPVRTYRVVGLDDTGDAHTVACPYPGMVPFRAADAQYFYGRDEEVTRMVQLLRRQRFMMVIGPSGSGKSSLVYAGLLPELECSRYFAKGYWLIRTLRPGPARTASESRRGAKRMRPFDCGTRVHRTLHRLCLAATTRRSLVCVSARTASSLPA